MDYSTEDLQLFQKYGVSPETHDLDRNTWEFVPKGGNKVQPEGELATFARSMAGGAGPTIGAGLGGTAGTVAGTALAPLAGPAAPIVPVATGIAGGVIGGQLGGKAQHAIAEAVAPDLTGGWNLQEEANIKANPKSAFAGTLASMLLSNQLTPVKNLKGLQGLFTAGGKAGAKKTAQQMAINAGIGSGMEAANEVLPKVDWNKDHMGLDDVEIEPSKIAMAGGANLLLGDFRKPFHTVTDKLAARGPAPIRAASERLAAERNVTSLLDDAAKAIKSPTKIKTTPEGAATLEQQFRDVVDPASSRAAVFVPEGTTVNTKLPPGLVEVKRPDGVAFVNPQKGADVELIRTAPEMPGDALGMSQTVKPADGTDVVVGEKGGNEVSAEVVNGNDPAAVKAATEAASNASPGADVSVKPAEEVLAKRLEDNATPEVKNQTDEDAPNAQLEAYEKSLLEEEAAGVKPEAKTPPVIKPLKGKISQAWYDLWKRAGWGKYGVTTDQTGGMTTPEGKPARGSYNPETRQVEVDPARADFDNQPHELFHAWLIDVAEHGNSAEKSFAKKMLERFGAEEPGVQATGEHAVSRAKGDDSFLKDALAFVKYKVGRANERDFARLASNEMYRGRGFKGEVEGIKPTVGGVRNQPDDTEEFEGGADVEKLISILRNKQDRGNVAHVAGRELIQNSIDALKQSGNDVPTVAFGTDDDNGTMMMVDNAGGMSPKFIITKFLKMGYSSKGIGNGGGFGIAKGQFLGNADKFEIRSLWTDPATMQRWLTKVVGDGQSFTKAQKPFKAKFTPDEEHVVPGGLRYTIEDVTGKHETTEDGTSVHLTYPKSPSGLYEAHSAVKESLRYNGDIKGVYLGDESRYSHDSPLTKGSGYGTHATIRNMDDDIALDYNYDTATNEKPSYLKHDTIKTTGANIDVFSKKGSPVHTGKWFQIPVLSNGIHQFDLSLNLPESVAMPEMSVNVRPTVEGQHKDYPFAIDRSSVSDNVSNVITQYFKDIGKREMQRRIDAFSAAKDNAPRMKIPGTEKYSLLDTAQKIPAELIDQIAKSPEMATIAHTLNNIHNVVRKTLGRRFPGQNLENADFRGMFMGTENAYGIRFGKEASDSSGEVYYDPLLLWKKATEDAGENATPDEVMSRWLGQTVGVALHENLHQKIHDEGEALARELTFTSGEIAMAKDSIISAIESNLDTILNNPKIHDTLKHFYTESKPFADSSKSGEFVSGIEAGFRMEAKPNEGNKRYQGDDTEPRKFEKQPAAILSSHVGKLRKSNDPKLKAAGDALLEAYHDRTELTGRWSETAKDALHADNATANAARDWVIHAEATETEGYPEGASDKLKAAIDSFRAMYRQVREDQNERGLPVRDRDNNMREGRMDPTGMPHLLDADAAYLLKHGQGTEEWHQMAEEFKDFNRPRMQERHQIGKKNPLSDEAIEAILDAKIRKLSGAEPMRGTSSEWRAHARALRLAEDTKLPPSMIEKDFKKLITKYIGAAAKDLALHSNVEAHSELNDTFGLNDQVKPEDTRAGNSELSKALDEYMGNVQEESKLGQIGNSASALATTAWTSNPVSRGKDFAGTYFRGLAHVKNPFQWPSITASAIKGLVSKDVKTAARVGGLVQPRHNFMDNMIGNTERVKNWVRKWANAYSTATGSEALENHSRYMAQGMGRTLVDIHGDAALRGDKSSQIFMEELAPVKWQEMLSTENGRNLLASRVGEAFQAAYNGSNLPDWALKGQFAPYARLMKWSIEQANNFRRFQLRPLIENKDPRPLAMYVTAMMGGGFAVKKLAETIANRQSYTPTWLEIENAKDKDKAKQAAMAKVMNAVEMVGMFGLFGALGNMVTQSMTGQAAQTPSNPFLSATGDSLNYAVAAGRAIMDGQDPMKVLPKAMDDIANSQISMYRVGKNWMADDKEKMQRQGRRDYSVYQTLAGEKTEPYNKRYSYESADENEFDRAELKDSPRIIREIIANTPREKLPEKMKKLASIGGTNMGPSSKDTDKLLAYIDFVRKTQGEAKARQLARTIMRDDVEKEVKRGLVPR